MNSLEISEGIFKYLTNNGRTKNEKTLFKAQAELI